MPPDSMSVLVLALPDAGDEAAQALMSGWQDRRPQDAVALVALAAAGVGFVRAMQSAVGGTVEVLSVAGPLDERVPATLLVAPDLPDSTDGGQALARGQSTAYVEAGQVLGPQAGDLAAEPGIGMAGSAAGRPGGERVRGAGRDEVLRASSRGVGELLAMAIDSGARRVVVGVGPSGVLDGGAGLLERLGACADPPGALDGGVAGLTELRSVDLGPARQRLQGVELVLATDHDGALLGLRGAANLQGTDLGLAQEQRLAVEGWLTSLAGATDPGLAARPGAGAGGGLGLGMLLLGAARVEGLEVVAEAASLDERLARADVVLVVTDRLEPSTLTASLASRVAGRVQASGRPCVGVSRVADLVPREHRRAGMDSVYSVVDTLGNRDAVSVEASFRALGQRVSRTWGRR